MAARRTRPLARHPLITATASAVAAHRDGRTYLRTVRSQVPISLRQTTDGLTVVASAFGPLGGDRTRLSIELQPGSRLDVSSAGAAVAQPGPRDPVSCADVHLTVGAGAHLRWQPRPLVVTADAEHRLTMQATAADGARALIAETVVLAGGRYRSSWRVTYAGAPLLHADLDVGPGAAYGWDGPAGTGGARVLVTALLIGEGGPPSGPLLGGEVMTLAGPGVLLQWLGDDAVQGQHALAAFTDACAQPDWRAGH